jgi:hypothetical protein
MSGSRRAVIEQITLLLIAQLRTLEKAMKTHWSKCLIAVITVCGSLTGPASAHADAFGIIRSMLTGMDYANAPGPDSRTVTQDRIGRTTVTPSINERIKAANNGLVTPPGPRLDQIDKDKSQRDFIEKHDRNDDGKVDSMFDMDERDMPDSNRVKS